MGKTWDGMLDDAEFSEEEDRIYNEAMEQIQAGINQGLKFDEACAGLAMPDAELKRVIIDDYLKIAVATQHFEKNHSLAELAASLNIEETRLERARAEMILEVGEKSAEIFRLQSAGQAGPGSLDGTEGSGPKMPSGNA